MTSWKASLGSHQIVAEIFIAETGGDMNQFPTPEQLASWAGSAPAPTSPQA